MPYIDRTYNVQIVSLKSTVLVQKLPDCFFSEIKYHILIIYHVYITHSIRPEQMRKASPIEVMGRLRRYALQLSGVL